MKYGRHLGLSTPKFTATLIIPLLASLVLIGCPSEDTPNQDRGGEGEMNGADMGVSSADASMPAADASGVDPEASDAGGGEDCAAGREGA